MHFPQTPSKLKRHRVSLSTNLRRRAAVRYLASVCVVLVLSASLLLMQFYGNLRRNPDPQDTDFRGWKFSFDKLNQFNANFVQTELVKSFLVSGEYRQRFETP